MYPEGCVLMCLTSAVWKTKMISGFGGVYHNKKLHDHDSDEQEQDSFSSQTLNASGRLEDIVHYGNHWEFLEDEHSHCPEKNCLSARKRKWNDAHHGLYTPMVDKYFEDLSKLALDEDSTSMAE